VKENRFYLSPSIYDPRPGTGCDTVQEGPEIVTPTIRNRGRRRRLAASFAVVALLGAGLVVVSQFLPRLMVRTREIAQLKAQNDELWRQLEGMRRPGPPHHSLSEEEVRRRLILTKPGEKIFVVPLPTAPPDPPDGYKNARIDHNGRMKMPADWSRVLQKHLGYPTPAKPTTKRRRQAADDPTPKTAR
jgi:cell division protein FtsB